MSRPKCGDREHFFNYALNGYEEGAHSLDEESNLLFFKLLSRATEHDRDYFVVFSGPIYQS
jgi:hypothetical protein